MDLPFAENISYWKTSKSTSGSWLDKAADVITKLGGEVTMKAEGQQFGRKAFLIDFQFLPERFRVIWPVLPTKGNDSKAAERQAATMLYHDVKAKALKASVFGAKAAFFEYQLLPDGRTINQIASVQLLDYLPPALASG